MLLEKILHYSKLIMVIGVLVFILGIFMQFINIAHSFQVIVMGVLLIGASILLERLTLKEE